MTILYIRITTSCNATRIYIVHQQMLVICSNKRKIAAFFRFFRYDTRTAHVQCTLHIAIHGHTDWIIWKKNGLDGGRHMPLTHEAYFVVVVSTLWMCWFVQKVDVEYGDKSWLSPITIPYPKRGHFSLLPFFFLFFVLLRWVSSSTSSMALILFFYISWTRTLLSLSRRDTMPESTIIAEHTFNISAWRRLFPAYLSK